MCRLVPTPIFADTAVGHKREPRRDRRTMSSAIPHIGVFLPTMAVSDAELVDVVAAGRLAEELGFESVWAIDQLVAGTGAPALIDSVVALATAAGATDRIGLGLGVLIVP